MILERAKEGRRERVRKKHLSVASHVLLPQTRMEPAM